LEIGLPGEMEVQFSERLAGDLEALIEKEGPDTIAAFIAEPLMGVGGVIPPPAGYFERIVPILRRHDILFITPPELHDLEFLLADALAANGVAAAMRAGFGRLVRVRNGGRSKARAGHKTSVQRAYHRSRILED
jgi:hypothetical protein